LHISSLDNFRLCLKKFVVPDPNLADQDQLKVVEIGSANFNGSYREIVDLLGCEYIGVDLEPGDGVSIVLDDSYVIPLTDQTYDLVYSGQTFEHAEFFWKTFSEMCRITKKNGLIIAIVPSSGDVHRYPVDCYRFMPDGMQALANHAGVQLLESWTSEFGPWHDAVGIFRNCSPESPITLFDPDLSLKLAQPVQNTFPDNVPEEVEHGAGTEDCYDFLVRAHQVLKPRFYTEIGVEYGNSLRLADCPALGIDPAPQLTAPLDPRHRLSLTTSDDFFMLTDVASQLQPIDLSYIDGMHQIEYALKDFMHMERFCHAGSVVIVDDIYPAHALQGERIRQSRYWTGDVWKIINVLENVRPDLILLPLDTSPTGSLLVLGLDPKNNALWEKFDVMLDWCINFMTETPDEIVQRTKKFDPLDPLITHVFTMIRQGRENGTEIETISRIREIVNGSLPRTVVPT
jgi:SAM-dependent methyltransferase